MHEPLLARTVGARQHDLHRNSSAALPQRMTADTAVLVGHIESQLGRARRLWLPLTLVAVAIERGGAAGTAGPDELAPEFARRLRARSRADDCVVWTPGPEFFAMLPGCRPEGATSVRLRLLAALGDTYALPSGEHRVAARVGFACHPAAGQSGAELLAEALSARDRPPGLQG